MASVIFIWSSLTSVRCSFAIWRREQRAFWASPLLLQRLYEESGADSLTNRQITELKQANSRRMQTLFPRAHGWQPDDHHVPWTGRTAHRYTRSARRTS